MPQFVSQYGMLIVLVIAMVGIMWFQSRNMKKRQNELKSFHDSLKPGVEVITIGGIIGKVVVVDSDHEEIVLDSEGSLLRVSFRAVNRVYVRVDFNTKTMKLITRKMLMHLIKMNLKNLAKLCRFKNPVKLVKLKKTEIRTIRL